MTSKNPTPVIVTGMPGVAGTARNRIAMRRRTSAICAASTAARRAAGVWRLGDHRMPGRVGEDQVVVAVLLEEADLAQCRPRAPHGRLDRRVAPIVALFGVARRRDRDQRRDRRVARHSADQPLVAVGRDLDRLPLEPAIPPQLRAPAHAQRDEYARNCMEPCTRIALQPAQRWTKFT